jgi:Na+/H+ antiporter NhaC
MNYFIGIIPPVIAIICLLITRNALFSLCLSVFVGSGIIIYYQGTDALYHIIRTIIFDPWNIKLIIGLIILGAFIGTIELALHRKDIISKLLNSKKKFY